MEIASLKMKNFRNFDNFDYNFSNKKNIIIGNNGVGKTNIIESIYLLSFTKSFRTNEDTVLMKNGEDYYKVEAVIKNKKKYKYKIIFQDNNKILKIDDVKINKYSDYISNINIILFNINDLKLIKDTPNTRRKLINLEISQLDNNYLKNLNYYNKILKQINFYYKSIKFNKYNSDYLSIMFDQLIDYGIKINITRNKFINNINNYLKEFYYKFDGIENIYIDYESSYNNVSKEELINKYLCGIEKDLKFGSVQLGIHRDDFVFKYDEYLLKDYASEGQQKSAIISFKLAELEVFHSIKGFYPILILDDLFSELDIKKIEKILKFINLNIQTFITTTDLKKIKKSYLKDSKIFELKNNMIKEYYYE